MWAAGWNHNKNEFTNSSANFFAWSLYSVYLVRWFISPPGVVKMGCRPVGLG